MSGILNTTGAVSGILGKTVGGTNAADIGAGVLPVGITGGSGLDASPLNGRNMIINGGMKLFQRATGATAAAGAYHTADRFAFFEVTDGAYTSEKHAMSLAEINTTGHSQAVALNVTTADGTIAAGQYSYFVQAVEAQNCQHLQWGTAAAKDATLSFWVKSKIAGTYCVAFEKADSTAYVDIKEYTIDDADTWEYKTITITPTDGSTTLITGAGGIIVNDSGKGISILFGLAWGSTYHNTKDIWSTNSDYSSDQQVNWMSSTSNDFYITGIQFEAGSVATPFEHRTYGDELTKCSRYFQKYGGDAAASARSVAMLSATSGSTRLDFHTEMRTAPTAAVIGAGVNSSGASVTDTTWAIYHAGAWKGCASTSMSSINKTSSRIEFVANDSCLNGGASGLYGGINTALTFLSEL
jgi:hypothetical protein